MTISGTLTHRIHHNDWHLQFDTGYTDLITGHPPGGDRHELVENLATALRTIAVRKRITDASIRVIDPNGLDVLGQTPHDGLLIGALRIIDGEIIPAVCR